MGRLKILNEPVSGVERLLEMAKLAGIENLQAVLACTFTFDRGYFEQVIDALVEMHADGLDGLRGVPIDVVCDHRHYRGHGTGYNVHCWKESNLFHPKLLMLCFADRFVWLEGSLNLTRAGHGVNRELASYHESDRRALPTGVLNLLRRLALQGLDAARLITQGVGRRRTVSRNRSLTSLDASLLEGLLGRVRHATQVALVAPFFDQREQGEPTIDTSALRRLAQAYPNTPFRIYLPHITGPDGKDALQAHRAVFSHAFGPNAGIERVAFCGVPSEQCPLHAKLIALQHGTRGSEATLLTGSPNITENALMRNGASANVELARELRVRWRDTEALLGRLGRKFRPLSECRFLPPPPIKMFGWHALQSAVYNPLERELELVWLKPMKETILRYDGKTLHASAHGSISRITIRADDLRLETVCRGDPSRYSWCPIVIPIDARLSLADWPESEAPPEWWITQLGALSGLSARRDGVTRLAAGSPSDSPTSFPIAKRVRDFAQRMNFAVAELTSADNPRARVRGLLSLLQKIFQTHDPANATTAIERTWRLWVRLEVTQALALSSRGHVGSRQVGLLARDLKAQLAATKVTVDAESSWRALTQMIG